MNAVSGPQAFWKVFSKNVDLQQAFDVAIIMPSIGRESIHDAVRSVYAQTSNIRIQLLIGIDAPSGDIDRIDSLLTESPTNVTPFLFYPGYSTSVRHGGLHPARDGGTIRSVLSYLANSRYLAYLDDDNWWAPDHLSSLLNAIKGKSWAFSFRWFTHPHSRKPICIDNWESVGPGKGVFAKKFGGWVDPNCLMFDKLACEPALRLWSIPLNGDPNAMSADRNVYNYLQNHSEPGISKKATTFYVVQPEDPIHQSRLLHMGERYANAENP